MYRVFLGAPPASAVNPSTSYHWQTFSSHSLASQAVTQAASTRLVGRTESVILPPATLEAASRRISMIYQNAIFDESVEHEESVEESFDLEKGSQQIRGDGSIVITWPPTEPQDQANRDFSAPSFLLVDESSLQDSQQARQIHANSTTAFLDSTRFETQESQSFHNNSDASSIGHFPTFRFDTNALTSLSAISSSKGGVKGSVKVNLLLAVLEVEGPDTIRIKKGPEAGMEVAILKMILGDEVGNVCKLTAWREVAEVWGGLKYEEDVMKRGDIVHLENVLMACEAGMSATLTASPNLKSKVTICYRTLPYTHDDVLLRPDLRLGESDPCVRRVAAVVRWFENMVGLPTGK